MPIYWLQNLDTGSDEIAKLKYELKRSELQNRILKLENSPTQTKPDPEDVEIKALQDKVNAEKDRNAAEAKLAALQD